MVHKCIVGYILFPFRIFNGIRRKKGVWCMVARWVIYFSLLYELAKKLYNVGVVIESECRWCIGWDKCETEWTLIHKDDESASYTDFYPAPNTWEVIEFLNTISLVFEKPNNYTTKMYNFVITMCRDCWYVVSCQFEDNFLFEVDGKTLIEVLEATLEYLLDNGYIWNKNF